MSESAHTENDFLNSLTEIIDANISNEQFGVSELAGKSGMSRSNLLRKIQKFAKVSASQFIRQVRLQRAMELLKQNSLNVSQVCYKVGFSSTSYFIKCFREYYGFSPGEVGKRDVQENENILIPTPPIKRKSLLLAVLGGIIFIAALLFFLFKPSPDRNNELEKSIAVLPFINDSNDSTNVHIINGLMESVLNNLQKIQDLRVISRTSVERYRNAQLSIPEIAKELNVSYIVEGSGQKIGDKILLTVQLIEASSDKHLWSEQYMRETKDIFDLQKEVAKNIAAKIEVIITPEEEERIDKIPTDNLVAYDYYLKGLDLFRTQKREKLEEAISFFKKAIDEDEEFASAYANVALAYYYLDIFKVEKLYTDEINLYADKALLYDSKLSESLIAKAMYYMHVRDFEQVATYLVKALEYNPNSALVINILSDFYARYIPNTEKYLEYALKGIRLDIAANDSVTTSYIYLHLSNALVQLGFASAAELYINKSLEFNPRNSHSENLKAFIMFAKNKDLEQTSELLLRAFETDTTRLDIMQEIAKIYFYMRNYPSAYAYYKKFNEIIAAQKLDIYGHEKAKIGYVYSQLGLTEESKKFFADYKHTADKDESIYKDLSLTVYYAYHGNSKKALEHLSLFSEQDKYPYWIIIFLKIDPLMDNIIELPETQKILLEMEKKFMERHERIKAKLQKENLL